jgi:hypothetical protein
LAGLCALRGGGEEGFQQFVQKMAERGGAEALGLVKLVTPPTPQTAVVQKEERYKTREELEEVFERAGLLPPQEVFRLKYEHPALDVTPEKTLDVTPEKK